MHNKQVFVISILRKSNLFSSSQAGHVIKLLKAFLPKSNHVTSRYHKLNKSVYSSKKVLIVYFITICFFVQLLLFCDLYKAVRFPIFERNASSVQDEGGITSLRTEKTTYQTHYLRDKEISY